MTSVVALDRDALVSELGRLLAEDGRVRLALLFGSRGRGTERATSDVDLAVDAPREHLLDIGARVARRLGVDVDVVPLGAASIPLLGRLVQESIPVWEAERGLAAAWRSRALAELETDGPWYRRMRDAWMRRVAREGLSGG